MEHLQSLHRQTIWNSRAQGIRKRTRGSFQSGGPEAEIDMDVVRLQAPDCALKMLCKEGEAKKHKFQTHIILCENTLQATH